MKDTRQLILNTTIQLFNENGIGQVSIRDIAKTMSLSPGNITYHFKSINDLFSAIYNQMKSSMDAPHRPQGEFKLTDLDQLLITVYQFQWAHRFFFTDIVTVYYRFPQIIKKHNQVRKERSNDSMILIKKLIGEGLLKKSESFFNYENLLHSIWMMYPGAIVEVSTSGGTPKSNNLPVQLAWNLFIPHLTEKGMKCFMEMKK